jgi:hypothetical protein
VDDRRRIGHRPDDRHAGAEVALDRGRRDRGGDREHGLLGLDQRADLAEQGSMSCGLTETTTRAAPATASGVRKRDRDPVPLAQLVGTLLAARRRRELVLRPPAGREQAADQRLADLARAEYRDLRSSTAMAEV